MFVVESYARLFLQIMYAYRRRGRFQLHAFVLMPEHVHLLITPGMEVTLERAIQLIKGGYSHEFGVRFGRRGGIWQKGFTDHRIRDGRDFENHRVYIHSNPVKRKLVERAGEYRYCSAFPGFKFDEWPSAADAASFGAAWLARVKLVPFPVSRILLSDHPAFEEPEGVGQPLSLAGEGARATPDFRGQECPRRAIFADARVRRYMSVLPVDTNVTGTLPHGDNCPG